jgi:ribonuclease T2
MRLVVIVGIVIAAGLAAIIWLAVPAPPPATPPFTPIAAPAPAASLAPTEPQYVLAVNWQPGFCEVQPNASECRTQTAQRFDATNFSLHGLWPQNGSYCGATEQEQETDLEGLWLDLPQVELPAALRDDLERVMPGTQSFLDRHEWIKHGGCYGADMEEYFGDSLLLLAALNGSQVRELFAASLGMELRIEDVRQAFDEAFGNGAGERITMACNTDGSRQVIRALEIRLAGEITAAEDFADLILSAPPTEEGGCRVGVVDPAGQQ